jgi:Repeat of unknown function (DUF5648)
MSSAITRCAVWAVALASFAMLPGCYILGFGPPPSLTKLAKATQPHDGPALDLAVSFRADVELRPCEQTTDALGYTIYCDYVFPDGTRIRSVFEFDYLTGNVVFNRYSPIILQLPANASYFSGTFDNGIGTRGNLVVTSGLSSVPVDTSTTLRAEPGMQLVIVDLPAAATATAPGPLSALPAAISIPGRLSLQFDYRANTPTIKVMSAAKFQLGSRTFHPSLLPCVTSFSGLAPLNATAIPSGQAVTGWAQPCNSKIYNFLGTGDPGPHPLTVVEFYNAALDHYFITWNPEEIAGLDTASSARGWTRTGLTFNVYKQQGNGTSAVCRYYLPPQYGDSHFFGRGAEECRATGDRNPAFVLEQSDFMQVWLPTQGFCPANTRAIYRVFSNRIDANHRYTTDPAVRDRMVQRGWLAEGDGPDQVVMCGPT